MNAAKGIWKSIFYSAIGGYILLMAFLFAATKVDTISSFDPAVNPFGGGSVISILYTSLGGGIAFKTVMLITTAGQIFCVTACLTSCSRMMFAFSRDGAVPGGNLWKKVNKHHVPLNAVLASAFGGVVMTLLHCGRVQLVHLLPSMQLYQSALSLSISHLLFNLSTP
jgi:amino acid transporter